ncbi:SMP-30/gluconolactonase/LRE family protein [Ensifer sp. YR511]|uniref:SMP-30/gluconolactonase/LRE family protein n=1 Tax=Ensifer sp. YR511 TaxID=1855294 RepID=UPI000891FDAA|nr:SMP-30/gluconolactonase/LRE family protein [Ensifer sp. YR511]SDO04753.1 gluconolactonase [Ensifer sp. YR511]
MFAAPPEITTEVWSKIPDELELWDRPSDFVRVKRQGQRLGSFLEGPSFDREGNLFVVDIAFGRIFKIDPERRWSVVAEYDGEPNGLKVHRDGRIFVADHKRGILLLDQERGTVEPVLTHYRFEPFKGVNDLFFAANGDLYFTDQGSTGLQDPTGRVFRWRTCGELDLLLDNCPSPNGLVLNLEEKTLYVCMTRANSVWRVPLLPKYAGVDKVGNMLQLSGSYSGGPDGAAIDERGNLYICHPGLGSVWVFDRFGEPIYRIRSCEGRSTTNLSFGGGDRKTLFVTESSTGSILKAQLPFAGRPMFSHA